MNAKTANKASAPANPAPATESEGVAAATVTAEAGKAGKPVVKLVVTNRAKAAEQKLELLGTVRQRLAHVADIFKDSSVAANEATEIAADAAFRLYQAQRDGLLSKDEVSAVLGDAFGYKKKADGTDGKTPDGAGEAIRKRVVRLYNAHRFVRENEADAFFKGMDSGIVEQELASVESGGKSIYSAYDALGQAKAEGRTTVPPAFNPKAVMAMAEKLAEPGAANTLEGNEALQAAHVALVDVIATLYGAAVKWPDA